MRSLPRANVRAEGQPVKLLFTCERHWSQRPAEMGARRGHPADVCRHGAARSGGALALAAGAAEVQIVGCPPEDCANREGNLWLQRRLEREPPAEVGPGVRRCADHHRLAAAERFSLGVAARRQPKPRPRAMI